MAFDPCAMRDIEGRYLAATAVVQGDVQIGEGTNVWHHVVIRGDVAPIRIGRRCSIQDGTMLHCRHTVPMEIGDEVIFGHHAVGHCRRIGSRTLVGINAVVLDDAEIGEACLIAAGCVVPPGTSIPDRSVVMGTPGRVVRQIGPTELAYMEDVARRYVLLAQRHAAGEYPAWRPART